MSQFNELLAQLQAAEEEQSTLAKALPQEGGEDDEVIQAAAAEGAEGEENPEDKDEGEGEKPMAKSMIVDGEEVEVIDADQLVKSLEGLKGRVDEQESVLAKGLGTLVSLVKGQGDLIKSMQAQLTKLAGQPAGRKTVLSVHERQPAGEQLTKSQQDGQLTVGDFLAKSDAALQAKKITGLERTVIDVSVREGKPVDQGLIAKVLS